MLYIIKYCRLEIAYPAINCDPIAATYKFEGLFSSSTIYKEKYLVDLKKRAL